MELIYWGESPLISHQVVRRNLLRLPDVMVLARDCQNYLPHRLDVFHLFQLPDHEYAALTPEIKKLVEVTAKAGLLKRVLKRLQIEESDLEGIVPGLYRMSDGRFFIRRDEIESAQEWRKVFVIIESAMFDSSGLIKILNLGPGFDNFERLLHSHFKFASGVRWQFEDVFMQDPWLSWFWPEVSAEIRSQNFEI